MLKEHFRSRGYIEGGIVRNLNHDAMDMEALPPFLRTLLVTDGTVTKSLEAFFWENVKVEQRWQEQCSLTQDLPSINAKIGDYALKRDVLLRGCSSNDVYAYATSFLLTDLLDEKVKNELIEGKIGIGELLREIGLETYREVVDFGREVYQINEKDSEKPEFVEAIYRTYVINIGGKPAIQITERFPYRLFQKKAN
jgi:chorismate-pyruvate lyase